MSLPVSETNVPSGSSWLRWALVALLLVGGIVLALVLGTASHPVVQIDPGAR